MCKLLKKEKEAALGTVIGFHKHTASIDRFHIEVMRSKSNEGKPCVIPVSVLMEE